MEKLDLLVAALKDHVRVNVDLKTVEIYDAYGVKTVLRDLDADTYDVFASLFKKY